MTDIIRLDAATLAAKIAAKELSSTEVTQACQIRRHGAGGHGAQVCATYVGVPSQRGPGEVERDDRVGELHVSPVRPPAHDRCQQGSNRTTTPPSPVRCSPSPRCNRYSTGDLSCRGAETSDSVAFATEESRFMWVAMMPTDQNRAVLELISGAHGPRGPTALRARA